MSLRIIGAGYGRTGTQSLKAALETLRYGPCYGMRDVIFSRPGFNDGHLDAWHDFVCNGRPMDWEWLLASYDACLDSPGHYFFRDLTNAFPEAGVILTVRDPRRWLESWQALQETSKRVHNATKGDPLMQKWGELMQALHARTFGDKAGESATMRIFKKRVAEVRETVPPGRLLIFDVQQGWAPLCDCLGCPVPDVPFPHLNDRESLERAAQKFLAGNVV